ncbi:hypothetical protein HYALB_00006585 [Hymenoscyphus albidus]|uniref:Uncharacterized protein n=1 Tax=Hymenoscyphus albidus TaxID=595503 RepID=A0A9N9LR40_9HELO|nr:hypothetical protein HYALB_00006585 [Hymenoscyphus albidus]
MASLYKTHLREMLDKFLREGTSLAESRCNPTKEGFMDLYKHCAQEVRQMGFANSILALHTVEAMHWGYLWAEPFAYEVPELQNLYMEWRDSEAEAKDFLDAVCTGLTDTPRILPAPFIFRGSNELARGIVKLEAPPNTRATSPSSRTGSPQRSRTPALPPKHGFKVEYDESKEVEIKRVLSRITPFADTEPTTPKKTQPDDSESDEQSPPASTRILRSNTFRGRTFFRQDGTTRVIRSPCKPRSSLIMSSMAEYRSLCDTETAKESPKNSPDAMRGVVMTSPPPVFADPVVSAPAIVKRKFQPEFKDATPSYGSHLHKKSRPNEDDDRYHVDQESNLKSVDGGFHYNLRQATKPADVGLHHNLRQEPKPADAGYHYNLRQEPKPADVGFQYNLRQEPKSNDVGSHYPLRKKSKVENLNQHFSKYK